MSWNGDDGQESKREDIADLLAEDGHHAALNYDDCERALRTWYANVCRSDHGIAFPNSAEDCVDSDDVPAHARAWRADMDSTTSDETTSSSCADIPPGCRRINVPVPRRTGNSIMTESPGVELPTRLGRTAIRSRLKDAFEASQSDTRNAAS